MLSFPATIQEARQLRQAAGGGQAAGEVGAAAAGRHQVDIDSLAFNEGGHTMSNIDCTLPKKSYRTSFKVLISCAGLSKIVSHQFTLPFVKQVVLRTYC